MRKKTKYYKHNKYEKVAVYSGYNLIIHNTDKEHKGKMFGAIFHYDLKENNYKEFDQWNKIPIDEYIQLTGFDDSVMRNYI